jgi:hypothetical protein
MDKITETKQSIQFTQLRDVESGHLESRPIIWYVTKTLVESRTIFSATQILNKRNIEEIFVHQIPSRHFLGIKTSLSKQMIGHLLHCYREWSDERLPESKRVARKEVGICG